MGGTITLVTTYPYDDTATIVVINNADMPLYVRIPGWASHATVYVNESPQATPANGTMLRVPLSKGQNTVVINFNPSIRLEPGYNGCGDWNIYVD